MRQILFIFLLSLSFSFINAQKLITGVVLDAEDNQPLPGVNIIEKGSTNGAITDLNGAFQFNIADSNATIQIKFIGYVSEEISISNQNSIHVSLHPDVTALEEIVVIGYGTQKTSMLTGAISGIHMSGRSTRSRRRKKTAPNSAIYGCSNSYTEVNTESYAHNEPNGFKTTQAAPLSTFSIDVDRASYSNVRRFINNGQKPPSDAIRVEEMINYFKYSYPEPEDEHPLNVFTEVTACPWNKSHLLMQVGMKAIEIDENELPPSNLVFLIDVSGSMSSVNKLPLVKSSLNMLTDKLRDQDRVAIVVYAGAAGLVLPSTNGRQKEKIRAAITNLNAGGSTAGGEGIRLAYKIAEQSFLKNGNNRVIIATDGDFNVGAHSDNDMKKLIEQKKESGIFLTCLGYGMGNYKDSKLETLADKGNGNYAYIDNMQEAEKTLVEEFGGTLFTVAKDVKIQIEFNPSQIDSYRLIGYENRLLNDEDFNDDTKDAGEVGAGHTVTALYEIIPKGVESKYQKNIDKLKYQNNTSSKELELATVKVRYKPIKQDESVYFDRIVSLDKTNLEIASENLRFSASVAMFGMLLSESEYVETINFDDVLALAMDARKNDNDGYKAEFIRLVKSARSYR